MKLFIKRDDSASKAICTVYDELGNPKYYASFQKMKPKSNVTIVLKNTQNNVIAKIRQLPIVGTNTFVFKVGKSHVTFVTVLTQKGIHSYFYGNNWHIKGEVITKNFSIIDVDNSVILSQKNCGDSYELTITDSSNELYCIATSICVSLINTVDNFAVQAV